MVHGYSSEYGHEQHCSWPGYEGMQEIFPERFNKRQPASADFAAMNDHVARIQKALMQGTVQMDLGVLRTDYFLNNAQWLWAPTEFSENNLRSNRAYYWQDMTLHNAGYTYDYFSPYLLQDPEISLCCRLVNRSVLQMASPSEFDLLGADENDLTSTHSRRSFAQDSVLSYRFCPAEPGRFQVEKVRLSAK